MLTLLDPRRDLRLSGQVIYTGRSSMEVAVKMESVGQGKPDETVLMGTSFALFQAQVDCTDLSKVDSLWFVAMPIQTRPRK